MTTATATSRFEPISFKLWTTDRQAFVDRLGASFRETGFAVISDHPISQAVIDRGVNAGKQFFALPDETKRKYFIPGGGGQRAYTPFATEVAKGAKAKDLKEFWHVAREIPRNHKYADIMGANLYVAEVPGWKEATSAMFSALDAFGLEVLSAIAIHLKLDPHFFDKTVNDGNSILRLLHYPPQLEPPPEGGVRAGAHRRACARRLEPVVDRGVAVLIASVAHLGLPRAHAAALVAHRAGCARATVAASVQAEGARARRALAPG